jgi:F-type H+-transporting ATPase subunit delta
MIEPTTLARPYARAAFEYAKGADALAAWQQALRQLAAVSGEEKVHDLLRNPGHTAGQRAAALAGLIGDDLTAGVENLLAIMADNGRLALLPEVAEQFDRLKQNIESAVTVDVTSAYPLSDAEVDRLSAAMTSQLKRAVTLTSQTDPSLLGWAIIRADDLVIDGSVRGRLNKLAGSLTQ